MRYVALLLASCALISACASSTKKDDEEFDDSALLNPGRNEALPSVSYEQTAESNWLKGETAFKDEEYLTAQRYYAYVRSKYPYSRFAVLSDLRIGDCQFERKKYIEAIDTYQNFVRLHPTHSKVPYAMYRTGVCYYEQIPTDWFMLPPSEEKDQSAVRDTERALRAYVDRFPKDENQKDAQKVLKDVRKRLMAHERYVADFYRKLDKDRAYVGRLEVIRAKFADVGLDDELLLEIAEVYWRIGEKEKAKQAIEELKKKFPASPKRGDAEALLTKIP